MSTLDNLPQASDVRNQLKAQLGYYQWSDIAQCACALVRQFGISGSKDVLEKIHDVLSALGKVKQFLSTITAAISAVESLGNRLFSIPNVEALLMAQLSKLGVCPLMDQMIQNSIKQLGIVNNTRTTAWFSSKMNYLNAQARKNIADINAASQTLSSLIQMALIMEECATQTIPQGKTLQSMLTGTTLAASPKLEAQTSYTPTPVYFPAIIPTIVNTSDKVSLCKLASGEIWFCYESNGIVFVAKKFGDTYLTPVSVCLGYNPTIYYTGQQILIYYMLNGKLYKVQFWPNGLGFITLHVKDCSTT